MPVFLSRALALVVCVLACLMSVPAFAHAQLLSAQPSHNSFVQDAPPEVVLQFNEPVSALAIALVQPDGTRIDLTAETVSGEKVVIPLPSALSEGTHILSWRVVSADAHPIANSLIFSIGTVTGGGGGIPSSDRLVTTALWASKALLFLSLFVGVGGALFALVAPLPASARKIANMATIAGAVLAPLSLGLHGLDALGSTLAGLLEPGPWSAAAGTSYGLTTLLILMACIPAAFALNLRTVAGLAVLAALLASIGPALSGHAGAADPQWLTRPAVALHMAALLFWIGALIPLFILLVSRTEAADLALRRFSRFAPFAIGPLLLSGIVLGTVQLGLPGEHWLSAYAGILATKLALLVVLFALALWNRLRLTQPALQGHVTARYMLRQFIVVEMVLVIAILGLAAGWRFTPPPRALADVAEAGQVEPIYVHAMDDQIMADIVVTPGRTGPVTLDILMSDTEGAPVEPMGIDVTLSAPDFGIEPFTAPAQAHAEGGWQVEGLTVPVPGTWQIALDVRLTRFSLVNLSTSFEIAR